MVFRLTKKAGENIFMVYQNTNGKSKDEFEVYDIKPAVEFAADLGES